MLGVALAALTCAVLTAALTIGAAPAAAQTPGGDFVDANHCGDTLGLGPGSDYANGSCQLRRFVPAGDGWSRLQLKRAGEFLAARDCGRDLTLKPHSDVDSAPPKGGAEGAGSVNHFR